MALVGFPFPCPCAPSAEGCGRLPVGSDSVASPDDLRSARSSLERRRCGPAAAAADADGAGRSTFGATVASCADADEAVHKCKVHGWGTGGTVQLKHTGVRLGCATNAHSLACDQHGWRGRDRAIMRLAQPLQRVRLCAKPNGAPFGVPAAAGRCRSSDGRGCTAAVAGTPLLAFVLTVAGSAGAAASACRAGRSAAEYDACCARGAADGLGFSSASSSVEMSPHLR